MCSISKNCTKGTILNSLVQNNKILSIYLHINASEPLVHNNFLEYSIPLSPTPSFLHSLRICICTSFSTSCSYFQVAQPWYFSFASQPTTHHSLRGSVLLHAQHVPNAITFCQVTIRYCIISCIVSFSHPNTLNYFPRNGSQ